MKLKNNSIQISCDGGAATGKSTGAKMIAKKYNLKFLSSGLLYRYAAFLILKNRPRNKINFLKKKFKKLNYKKLDKINLHTVQISELSAIIAKKNKVRNILKKFQIDFSKKNPNCCIEGRDISTKILPNSDLKFFFKCDLNKAAKRRFKELKKREPKIKINDVKRAKNKKYLILKGKTPLYLDIQIDRNRHRKIRQKNNVKKMSTFVERVIKKSMAMNKS